MPDDPYSFIMAKLTNLAKEDIILDNITLKEIQISGNKPSITI